MVEAGQVRRVVSPGQPDLFRLMTAREIAAFVKGSADAQTRACCPHCQRMIVVGARGTFVLHGYKDMGETAARFNGTECKGTNTKPVKAA